MTFDRKSRPPAGREPAPAASPPHQAPQPSAASLPLQLPTPYFEPRLPLQGAPGAPASGSGADAPLATQLAAPTGDCFEPRLPGPSPDMEGLGPVQPLAASVRERFEPLLGRDLGAVSAHPDSTAATALGARALTVGSHIAFAPGRYAPGTPAGERLIAHELAHTVQQTGGLRGHAGGAAGAPARSRGDYEREADRAADNLVAGRPAGPLTPLAAGSLGPVAARAPSRFSSRAQLQPETHTPAVPPVPATVPGPAAPLTEAQTELSQREAELVRALETQPGVDGSLFVGTAGGMVTAERLLPTLFPLIRSRIIQRHGQRTFDGLYRNDARVMHLIRNSERIVARLQRLQDRYSDEGQHVAWDLVTSFISEYTLYYPQAVQLYARHGDAFLAVYELFLSHPDDITADDLRREAENAQVAHDEQERQRAAWAETGQRAVGRTIATREVFAWWDDTYTLQRLLEPEYGFATRAEALTWASISGHACAVLQAQSRYYVYALNASFSLADALATGFHERTAVVTAPSGSGITLTTADGVVLDARGGRYFAGGQTRTPEEGLEGASRILEQHGEGLDSEQAFRLFRQMTRDLVFANLARSRAELTRERDRFFQMPGMPMGALIEPRAGAELQSDTAALRRHMMAAVSLADSMGEEPTEEQRQDLQEALAAIGRIHQRNPTAALMIRRNREDDATGPAREEDFEDRVAGQMTGDAAWAGASEIGRRLSNIERVQRHLLEHPDAVLDLTPLHEQVLSRFSASQRLDLQVRLALHDLSQLARALGIAVADIAVVITASVIGGPLGFGLALGSTAFGVHQTMESFEHVSLLRSMTELGFTSESALATPEMVTSAQRWAWVAAALTLIDVAGLAGTARSMQRMRTVLADPELARVLTYSRGNLREAADALGVTERELARDLRALQGAERTQLIERIRAAMEPRASGGRYGHYGWGEEYTVEVLTRMRRALMDDAADVDRVVQALTRAGTPLDRSTVATIKRYIFDSPGIAFTRENYDAWMRLATGRGQINDVRFLVHEAAETAQLSRRGFNFLGEGWESMGRHSRTRWHREFGGAYLAAHRRALGAEFDFIVSQISAVTGGRTTVTREVAAAVDASAAGREAREYMLVGEQALESHPQFYSWRGQANNIVPLDAGARARLGDALFNAIRRLEGEARAAAVARGGENPTLRELIAAVKAMTL